MNQTEVVEVVKKDAVIESRVNIVVKQAQALAIIDEASYTYGSEMLKSIKGTIKQVEAYWKGPKDAADKAHKAICEKESDMKKPLESAEKTLKDGMSDYLRIKEDEKKKLEQEAYERYGVEVALQVNAPQVKGITAVTDYEIIVEDISKVPNVLNGVQIVQVDTAAIKKLAKLMKGQIVIPGIRINETKSIRSSSK